MKEIDLSVSFAFDDSGSVFSKKRRLLSVGIIFEKDPCGVLLEMMVFMGSLIRNSKKRCFGALLLVGLCFSAHAAALADSAESSGSAAMAVK